MTPRRSPRRDRLPSARKGRGEGLTRQTLADQCRKSITMKLAKTESKVIRYVVCVLDKRNNKSLRWHGLFPLCNYKQRSLTGT